MAEIDVYEVVKKLIGPIVPVGDSYIDSVRLENLKRLTSLVNGLLTDISDVASDAGSHMHSVKIAGEHAANFCTKIGVVE